MPHLQRSASPGARLVDEPQVPRQSSRRKRGRAAISAGTPGGSDAGSPPAAAPRRVRQRQARKQKQRRASVGKSASGGEPKAAHSSQSRRRRRAGAGQQSGPGITACLLHSERGLRAGGVRNHLRPTLLSESHVPTAGVGLGMCHACFMWSLRHYGLDRQPHLHCYRRHDGEQVLASKCRERIEKLRALGVQLRDMDGPCACPECAHGTKGSKSKKAAASASKPKPRGSGVGGAARGRARTHSATHVAGGSACGSTDDDSSVCSATSAPSTGASSRGGDLVLDCVEAHFDLPRLQPDAVFLAPAKQEVSGTAAPAARASHPPAYAPDQAAVAWGPDAAAVANRLVDAGLAALFDDAAAADAALAITAPAADMTTFLDGLFDLPHDQQQQQQQQPPSARGYVVHAPPPAPVHTFDALVVPGMGAVSSGVVLTSQKWAPQAHKASFSLGLRTGGGTPCSTHQGAAVAAKWGPCMSPPGGVAAPFAHFFSE